MDKFNLIDIGNIGEPMAGIVNNFIDKISNAIGWVVTPKNIKPFLLEANKSIINEIANREDINPLERAAIINNYRKIVKEFKNQTDIVRIAINHLEKQDNSGEVNEEWLMYFFDIARNITDEGMKIIWGKILAGEFNSPNTYSKRFIQTLSVMDSNIASAFENLKSSCFYRKPYLFTFVYRTNKKDIKNAERYKELGITFRSLRELDSFGLIKYRYPNFYAIQNNGKKIIYGDKVITLTTNKKLIEVGNVSLTDVGKQFCKITDPKYDDRILDICIDAWKTLVYNPIIR